MNELFEVEKALAALINRSSPAARRRMNAGLARKLRQRQQSNIQKQQEPDGTPFIPRKNKTPGKRVMFRRLRTVRFMKTKSTPDDMCITFSGSTSHIASVHHYGLRDKVSKKGRRLEVKYTRRQLLGLTAVDDDLISGEILDFLSK